MKRTYLGRRKRFEDMKTCKFIILLLKYNYVYQVVNEEFKLNLSDTEKRMFLQECRDSGENLDEMEAAIKIEQIRNLYTQEIVRAQNFEETVKAPLSPWFHLADRLFKPPFEAEKVTTTACSVADSTSSCVPSITTLSASVIAICTEPHQISAPDLPINDTKIKETTFSQPTTSITQPFSLKTSNSKLPTFEKNIEKSNICVTSQSVGKVYLDERFPRNARSPHDLPENIASDVSHCIFKDDSRGPCSRQDTRFPSKNEIPASYSLQTSNYSETSVSGETLPFANNLNEDRTYLPLLTDRYSSCQSCEPSTARASISFVDSSCSSNSHRNQATCSVSPSTGTTFSTLPTDSAYYRTQSRASIFSQNRSSIIKFSRVSSPFPLRVPIRQIFGGERDPISRGSTSPVNCPRHMVDESAPKTASQGNTPMITITSDIPSTSAPKFKMVTDSQPTTPLKQSFRPYQKDNDSVSSSSPKIASEGNTSVITIVSDSLTSAPKLKVVTDSLPSIPSTQFFSGTNILPYGKNSPHNEHLTQYIDSSWTLPSIRSVYHNENFLRNARSLFDFPIKYPVCILSSASLGNYMNGSGGFYSKPETRSLSRYEIPISTTTSLIPKTIPSNRGASSNPNIPLKKKPKKFYSYYSAREELKHNPIKITKLLELLLKYNYVWRPSKYVELNLPEAEKMKFLEDYNVLVENNGEQGAYIYIEIARYIYIEELSRMQDDSNAVNESIFPWFYLARQAFH